MNLGDRLVLLRKKKGFSQELLAEHAGVSLRTIQRLEKDNVIARADTLKRLAQVLEVSFEELQQTDASDEVKRLLKMNISALLALIPTLNIFVSLLYYRNIKAQNLKESAQRILSFQILWTIATILLLVFIQALQIAITGSVMIGRFSILIPAYLICTLPNFVLTIRTSIQIKSGNLNHVYRTIPMLF
ncbi:helix-turn-helix domain-containing protein [Chryseotalea sanaruensis]|uniref:Helix-turn-helix domain-containing protein n=1 Tax=Chryseotalea sanaruensis TaxID=2482724 RepID=A0A401U806_9BACT|nr:helix-turn-helix transcriptional regulator [Chryseotalea sanaruensis]GCC51024.1 helix-turn-helix domain-containing protein [Chryseotalea sanaruensis]